MLCQARYKICFCSTTSPCASDMGKVGYIYTGKKFILSQDEGHHRYMHDTGSLPLPLTVKLNAFVSVVQGRSGAQIPHHGAVNPFWVDMV